VAGDLGCHCDPVLDTGVAIPQIAEGRRAELPEFFLELPLSIVSLLNFRLREFTANVIQPVIYHE
jgi:hypothetical protein